jgi:hypothetical protein
MSNGQRAMSGSAPRRLIAENGGVREAKHSLLIAHCSLPLMTHLDDGEDGAVERQ